MKLNTRKTISSFSEKLLLCLPTILRSSLLAGFIGLTVGVIISVAGQTFPALGQVELGLFMVISIWVSSLFLAVHLTEATLKKRLMARSIALIPLEAIETIRKGVVNRH